MTGCSASEVAPLTPGPSLPNGFPQGAPHYAWFSDATRSSGITAHHYPDLSQFLGSGAAAGDIDGDGRADLVIAGLEDPTHVYRNRGRLRFEDVTQASGIDATFQASGVALVELDGDGHRDLVLAGTPGARVYRGHGDGTFDDITHDVLGDIETRLLTSVLPLDVDADGLTDLLLTQFANLPGRRRRPEPDSGSLLLRNRGDGTFTHLSSIQLGDGTQTWTAALIDHDRDGDLDVLVGNDSFVEDLGEGYESFRSVVAVDNLYRNDGLGADGLPRFVDVGPETGVGIARSNMGVLVADMTADGIEDVFVSDWGRNDLLVGDAAGTFDPQSEEHGVARPLNDDEACLGPPPEVRPNCYLATWGAIYEDLDRDGVRDLVALNGDAAPPGTDPQPIQSYRGLVEGGFEEIQLGDRELAGRALVATDLDDDGDLDLVFTQYFGDALLWRNVVPDIGRWLRVRPVGRFGTPDAIGATAYLELDDGRTLVREIGRGGALESWSAPDVHFAWRDAAPVALVLRWPSGLEQRIERPAVDRVIELEEPLSSSVSSRVASAGGRARIEVRVGLTAPSAIDAPREVTIDCPEAEWTGPTTRDGDAFVRTLIVPDAPGWLRISIIVDGRTLSIGPRIEIEDSSIL